MMLAGLGRAYAFLGNYTAVILGHAHPAVVAAVEEQVRRGSAFAAPTGVRFGSSGRNTLRGPGVVNLALGLFKKFPIRERVTLETRIEAANVSNTPHFNNPNGTYLGAGFGQITSTVAGSERTLRFGFRMMF